MRLYGRAAAQNEASGLLNAAAAAAGHISAVDDVT